MVRTADRIDELFFAYSTPSGGVDMRGVFRLLWKTLTNIVSAVDLAGVFAVSIPSTSNSEVLSQELFQDFFKAYARLKYPLGSDYCEKLLDDIRHIKGTKQQGDPGALTSIADKNAIRVFLKYDLPLRRAFSTFCAQSLRVGSSVSWDEVKSLSLGMEVMKYRIGFVILFFYYFEIFIVFGDKIDGWVSSFLWHFQHYSTKFVSTAV